MTNAIRLLANQHHNDLIQKGQRHRQAKFIAQLPAPLYTYTAEPGSRHEPTQRLLGRWAATVQQPITDTVTERR